MAYEDDVLISGWDYPSDCVNRKSCLKINFKNEKLID